MDTNNKNKLQETGRWLRVTILTLATLGPIINALAARLRERAQALREAAGQLDLAQQSSNLTQEAAKRSSEVTRTFAERSSKASQELVKRSAALTHEVKQRSHQVTEQLAERDGTLWTIIGFGIGLIAASVVAYVFIRRRIQEQAEDNEQIQLSNDTHLNSPARSTTIGQAHPVNQPTSTMQTEAAPTPVEPTVAVAEPVPTETERPANTTLIGVASTKLYYPVETPLDQLTGSQEGPVEVVYFTSEDEAKAQGFVAA
jgi:flagellar basal body-associated protein FliL